MQIKALGNPEEQAAISVTSTAAEIQLTQDMSAIEFQNTGNYDCYFGKLSTVTSARGGVIYSGSSKIFENVPSNWKISFVTATGQTTTLRRIHYL